MTRFIQPFAALRPRPETAGDVIAPPYDVVSTDEARTLARDRPSSFLHISRPEIDLPPASSPYSDAAYAMGAKNLQRLRETGVLVRDARPSYYAYRMTSGGRVSTGIAAVASIAAYEANRVRKHERTRPDKENDRVRNIATLGAQTGPVLCAYRANDPVRWLIRTVTAGKPTFEAVGQHDVRHSVWCVSQPNLIEQLSIALNALDSLYIADGHHRAAAAARVAHEHATSDASQHFLVVAFPHDEMQILDYNRIVRDTRGLGVVDLLARLRESFDVAPSASSVAPSAPETFGMYIAGAWYRLRLRTDAVTRHDPVASPALRLLQDTLLSPVFGIGDPRTDPRIDFVGGIRGLAELERQVDSGAAAVA